MGNTKKSATERINYSKEILVAIKENAKFDEELGTYYAYIQQTQLAEDLDTSRVTINKHINKLTEEGIIDSLPKKGRSGGSIITFSLIDTKFETNPDNPITGTSKKAQAIFDKYFKPQPKKIPKRRYRTKAQIAEDNLKKTEGQKRIDALNDELESLPFVPKTFFDSFPDPDVGYRAYILGKLYESLIVCYAEDWKNQAERSRNKGYYEMANKAYHRYKNYRILKDRFMGTTAYSHLYKLVQLLDYMKIDALDYLDVHVNYMFFLLKNNRDGRPPFLNVLTSKSAFADYDAQVDYKRKFEIEHPYYKIQGGIKLNHTSYPILTLLHKAYKQGVNQTCEVDQFVGLMDDNLLTYENDAKFVAMYTYFNEMTEKVENSTEISDKEKEAITYFLKLNVALHTNRLSLPSDFILLTMKSHLKLRSHAYDDVYRGLNKRQFYRDFGNMGDDRHLTIIDNRKLVQKGYKLYFSVNGSSVFDDVIYTVADATGSQIDYANLRSGIAKLGVELPLTYDGLLDANLITDKALASNPILRDNEELFKENIQNNFNMQLTTITVDNDKSLWYNIYEPTIGRSKRDGSGVLNGNYS